MVFKHLQQSTSATRRNMCVEKDVLATVDNCGEGSHLHLVESLVLFFAQTEVLDRQVV